MKIAILSDSHDNIWKLEGALPHLVGAEVILHCGDLCSPFMLRTLGEGVGPRPIHLVWGNNDGDRLLLARVAAELPDVTLHGELAQLELDGVRLAVNHYPEIGRGLARSGLYDVVCYGHDHQAHQEWVGNCLLLNPGELMGMKGRSTLAILDTVDRSVRAVEV
ncbi:MAG: metallophosphoesterase [Chloroflexota bacterium]